MSFLKSLFGGTPKAPPTDPTLDIDGFTVRATPYQEAGQWQLCGVIAREVDGVAKEHRFVRADRFADRDTAIDMTFTKARLIIAERGARVFD